MLTSPKRHSSRSRPTSPTASPQGPNAVLRWLCVDQHRTTVPRRPAASLKLHLRIAAPLETRPQSSTLPGLVLNAGTAGLKHLSDFSTSTADLVKLKLHHWERVKKKTTSHTWSSPITPSLPTCHSCTNMSPRPVQPAQDRVSLLPGKHTLTAGDS